MASAGDVNGDGYGDIVVGAPYYADNDTGKVYVFHGGVGGLTGNGGEPRLSGVGESAGDLLGWSLAGMADVNVDGYGDIVVGAPAANSSAARCTYFTAAQAE